MILKKTLMLFLFMGVINAHSLKAIPHAQIRTFGIVQVGLALAAGGIYQLCKKSDNLSSKIAHSITGLTLIATGFATIILSAQLIQEIDESFK